MALDGQETDIPQDAAWREARQQVDLLERSAERMSSGWFLGNAGVATAAALFLLTALVLGTSVARMLDNAAKAHIAQAVQFETSALQDNLTESSAAARAYALEHDPDLQRDHAQAQAAAAVRLETLTKLLANDEEGLRAFTAMRPQIEQRIQVYDALAKLSGRPAITAGETLRLTLARRNNTDIAALRKRASDAFNTYQNRVIAEMRLSIALALVTGIVSPFCGLIGIYLLRRERESLRARELQLELMHVQRLAIMGETSAMLAHEINQPLTAAANYLAVMRRLLDNDAGDKAKAITDRIDQQIQRAAAILRKLRRFIEKREAEQRLEAPEILAEDAITLLGTIDSTVTLKTDIAPDLPQVLVDRVQLQQVLVNLMRNAIEAMQGSGARELVLEMKPRDSGGIEIALTDSGPGLAPEVASRLFQPFVTTKSGGMGVGLSICHSIISQHGGRIWAEACPKGGTVFRIVLPAAQQRAAA